MEKLAKLFILILTCASGLTARAFDVKNELNGVQMKSCSPKNTRCVDIRFKKAEMSHWSALFTFTDFEATYITENMTTIYRGKFGYFDLDQNKIMLKTETKKSKEILIDLKTLESQEFLL